MAPIVTVDVVAEVDDELEVPPPGVDGPDWGDAGVDPPPPQLCSAIPKARSRHRVPNL